MLGFDLVFNHRHGLFQLESCNDDFGSSENYFGAIQIFTGKGRLVQSAHQRLTKILKNF